MSGYGMLAITADAWTNARAQEILTNGLPPLPGAELRRDVSGEFRDPHTGKWIATPGGGGGHEVAKKLLAAIDDGDDEEILNLGEKLDKPTFDALPARDRKDIEDEFVGTALGNAVAPKDRERARVILGNLGLKQGKSRKASSRPTPTEPARPAPHVHKTSSTTSHGSSFDVEHAATDIDALDTAPTRNRALYEASLTPEERRTFLAKVDAMSEAEARRYGGRGPKAQIGENDHLSQAERDRMSAAADEYMQKAYIPINKALYDADGGPLGGDVDEQTREWIAELDRLLALSKTEQDAIFHRATNLPADLPDEMTLPGFTSMTHSPGVANAFLTSDLYGTQVAGKSRTGIPTVITLRVPKGTNAMQFSPDDILGEVLLHRDARIRKVDADDFDFIQLNGIRYVTYEVMR